MKKIIVASAAAMVLATGALADLKVGLGYNLSDALNGGNQTSVRVPLDFDFGLRIEPELGFGSTSDTTVSNRDVTTSNFLIGVGGYYNLWSVDKIDFYAGGRMAIEKSSRDVKVSGVTTSTDYTAVGLQGLFGAEYGITDNFTIAAQAGVEIDAGSDISSVGTVGHVILRYFFVPIGN